MRLVFVFLVAMAAQAAGTQVPVGTFPMSQVLTPDGKYMLVLCTGMPAPGISVIDLANAKEVSRTAVPDAFLGLAITKAGDKVYVGGGARAAVFEFAFANGVLTAGRTFPLAAAKDRNPQDFAGDVKLAPDGHLLYVANLFRDLVVVMNPQSGLILSRIKTGRRPYRILFHPSGKTMYVSSWADGTIGQYDVNSGERLANARVAPHPLDMLWVDGGLPEGANAGDAGQPEIKARMFVPAANTNNLYVLGAGETGDLTKLETINLSLTPRQPLGTTPSAVGISADKKLVYVACSDVNDVAVIDITGERNLVKGFVPGSGYPTAVAGLADGRVAILNGHGNSLQLVDAPDDSKIDGYTDQVMAAFPYRDEMLEAVGSTAAVKHVVYVVRGGDDLPATAGIDTDYAARLGPGHADDFDPANVPPAGYIWTAASQAGLKIRNYGFAVRNLAKANADGEQIDRVYDPALAASTDMEYRGADPAYPDIERAKEFATEMGEYDRLAEMPQLLLVRIGRDDAALGVIREAVKKSKFAAETELIVTGDTSPFPALRTVEMRLGLHPMTVFDAAAKPQ